MEVIQGGFGKEKDSPQSAGALLREQLEESGLFDVDVGTYTMFFETSASVAIVTNCGSAPEVLMSLEKGKLAIMAAAMEEGEGTH